jgi:FPC/CPF motif-containing protein YcgG
MRAPLGDMLHAKFRNQLQLSLSHFPILECLPSPAMTDLLPSSNYIPFCFPGRPFFFFELLHYPCHIQTICFIKSSTAVEL